MMRHTFCGNACAFVIASLALFASGAASVFGSPVTFRFEATINEVDGDALALNLPFPLAPGQQISGEYIFSGKQDFIDIFLHHELGKQGLATFTLDSIEIEATTNFGLLNSTGVLNPPITGPTSSISLGYISPTDVFPGWPGNVAGHPWSHELILIGPDGTITSSDQLSDVAKWNQLNTLRRLELQFGYPDTVSVHATVGDFVAVPEPSSFVLTLALVLSNVLYLLARRFRDGKSPI